MGKDSLWALVDLGGPPRLWYLLESASWWLRDRYYGEWFRKSFLMSRSGRVRVDECSDGLVFREEGANKVARQG